MSEFSIELETYASHLVELQTQSGKFVLIKGRKVEGVYDTYADALKVGYAQFELEPFLVKQIAATERIQHFTRHLEPACHS